MVKIMLDTTPQHDQDMTDGVDGSLVSLEDRGFPQKDAGLRWGQSLADQGRSNDPSRCILWCAIALGALVQGCSLEFVSRPFMDAAAVAYTAYGVYSDGDSPHGKIYAYHTPGQ